MHSLAHKQYWFYVILLLICLAAYSNSLSYSFVLDDLSLVANNPYIKNPRFINTIFQKDLYGHNLEEEGPRYYRPLQTLSLMLDYRIWKLNPFGYRLTNIFLHFINSILVFVIINLLFNNFFVASISSILFSIHPINTTAVVYISGRADLLASFFILAASLSTIYLFRCQKYKKIYFLLVVLFSLFALLSRESAVILPLAIILLYFFIDGDKELKIGLLASVVLSVFLYAYMRIEYLHIQMIMQSNYHLDIFLKGINFLHIISAYLFLLLVPANLYLMHTTNPIIYASDPRLWLTLAIFAAMIMLCCKYRSNKFLKFGVFWFIIFVSPVFFLMMTGSLDKLRMCEHWLYLCSIGFYLLFGAMLYSFGQRFHKITYALIPVVIVIYTILTINNNSYFKDKLSVAKRTLQFSYNNKEAHKEIAIAYLERKEYNSALEHINVALKLAPTDTVALLLLGMYYENTGDIAMAISSYKRLLEIRPDSSSANNNLGVSYLIKGDYNQAELLFKRSIELSAIYPAPYFNMARICEKKNDPNCAVYYYEHAISLNPDEKAAYFNLAKIYFKRQEFSNVIKILNQALAHVEMNAKLFVMLGVANAEEGNLDRALRYFNRALKIEPESIEARLNMGALFVNRKDFDKAVFIWKEALQIEPDNVIIKTKLKEIEKLIVK